MKMKREYQAPLAQLIEIDVDVIVASSDVSQETEHDNAYIDFGNFL